MGKDDLIKVRKERESGKRTPIPPNVRHSRFLNLECKNELDERICAGYTMPQIARWLQTEKQLCTDVGYDSLCTMLSRYRQEMKPAQLIAPRMPKTIEKANETVEKGLDELEELEKLYALQMERVSLGMDFEKKTKILNRFVNQEVALAAQILVRRHEIKMDLGVNGGRDIGTLTVKPEIRLAVENAHGEGVARAIADPAAAGKVYDLYERMVRARDAASEVIDVSFEEDDD